MIIIKVLIAVNSSENYNKIFYHTSNNKYFTIKFSAKTPPNNNTHFNLHSIIQDGYFTFGNLKNIKRPNQKQNFFKSLRKVN